MAVSIQQSNKVGCSVALKPFVPGDLHSAVTAIGWVDMQNFRLFAAAVVFGVLGSSGGVNSIDIAAGDKSDGSGTIVQVKAFPGTLPLATAGLMAFLEATQEEIAQCGRDAGILARYVSVRVQTAVAADRVTVLYGQGKPRFPQDALTPANQ